MDRERERWKEMERDGERGRERERERERDGTMLTACLDAARCALNLPRCAATAPHRTWINDV